MTLTIDPSRLLRLDAATLAKGGGSIEGNTACVMNWANFLAGGDGASDSHPCVSPVIRRLMISANDRLGDADRQRLKAFAAKALGTAGAPEVERRRAWMCADFAIREVYPLWLDLAGLTEEAARLRALPEVTAENHAEAKKIARAARDKAREVREAKRRQIRADAAAAYAAADAKGKTYSEVYAAARKAADERLAPTKAKSVEVLLGLLDRLIKVTEAEGRGA